MSVFIKENQDYLVNYSEEKDNITCEFILMQYIITPQMRKITVIELVLNHILFNITRIITSYLSRMFSP